MTTPTRAASLLSAGLLLALHAAAQDALPPDRPAPAPAVAPLSAPISEAARLYRAAAEPRTVSKPQSQLQRPLVAKERDPERTWKDNIAYRADQPDHGACPLSFTLGGDLDEHGYKGVRLFGSTHTLAAPRGER